MFGGKKLKDLTEEDIRRYAASLSASSREAEEAAQEGPDPSAAPTTAAVETVTPVEPRPTEARAAVSSTSAEVAETDTRKLAESIVERNKSESVQETTLAKVQGPAQESAASEASQRALKKEEQQAETEARLSEEELLRLEVLAELDRSQMPAVHTEDGAILKTIEHYTFADALEVATIYIELDKDLFDGAASYVTEAGVEVKTKETECTILVHGVPASKGVSTPADWRLHLGALLHSVEVGQTSWKLRKGKISVKLKKKKPQEWRRVLKL